MRLSIASYSFHRLLQAGKQDMFGYIAACQQLGATELDPWNGHLAPLRERDPEVKAQSNASEPLLTAAEETYLERVLAAANQAGLPFGCLAIDGAHIYEDSAEDRRANRRLAYRWLETAVRLGCKQVRIDAGGSAELPDEMLAIISDGYKDLIGRAAQLGIEVLIENHWGPSPVPENVIRILEGAPGLGLLFDTNNWAAGRQMDGWQMCARYARSCHVKSFGFDESGRDPSVDLEKAIRILLEQGYDGCWGVESSPTDGDETGAVEKTLALIRRTLISAGQS
jgi:sugar phosphate isomerase/epimerase